jgi:hypothetical protein
MERATLGGVGVLMKYSLKSNLPEQVRSIAASHARFGSGLRAACRMVISATALQNRIY